MPWRSFPSQFLILHASAAETFGGADMGKFSYLFVWDVTTCAVVGCTSLQLKGYRNSLICFPADSERRMWVTALQRQRQGDLKWCPGSGDRVCSAHFQSGLASNDPWEADNVPDLATRLQREKTLTVSRSSSSSVASYCR